MAKQIGTNPLLGESTCIGALSASRYVGKSMPLVRSSREAMVIPANTRKQMKQAAANYSVSRTSGLTVAPIVIVIVVVARSRNSW